MEGSLLFGADVLFMSSRAVLVVIVPFSAESMSAAKVVEVVCEFFATSGDKAVAATSATPPFADSVTSGTIVILDKTSIMRCEYVQECIDEAALLPERDGELHNTWRRCSVYNSAAASCRLLLIGVRSLCTTAFASHHKLSRQISRWCYMVGGASSDICACDGVESHFFLRRGWRPWKRIGSDVMVEGWRGGQILMPGKCLHGCGCGCEASWIGLQELIGICCS